MPSVPTSGPFYDACSYPLDDSVGAQLANLVLMLRRELDMRMTEHGLTDAQWKPLWMLLAGRATTANELARCSHIDAGAMTRMLDRLEAKGLVERLRSDTDRRVVQLRLTPTGEQAAQQVPQVLASVNNDVLRGFSADEWQLLRSFLQRMTSNCQTLHPTEEHALNTIDISNGTNDDNNVTHTGSAADAQTVDAGAANGLCLSAWTALVAAVSGASLTVLGTCASLVMLAGCASQGPAVTPHAFISAQQAGAGDSAGTPWPATRWWSGFGDPQLDALVDQALVAQPSLQSTQARLRQAQAALDATGAATLPQVSGSADLTNTRFSENGLVPPLGGRRLWNNNVQIGASWELDLFGRQRAAIDSAVGQLRAAQAETQAANVLLAGNTAIAYFNLARLVETRAVAQAALQQRQQVLELVRQRVGAGLDTKVDLRQAEGLIAQSQAEIEALAESIDRARHALAEIIGQGPRALDALAPAMAAVRSVPLPQGLPADLLGRRADLVAQRWRVEAATRDVDVARAQFYPNINLTAFIGLQSLGLDKLAQAGSLTYGAGPALRLPIFEGGRLRANLSARQAEVDASIDAYNATLLRALREVADEVATLQSVERQQASQNEATAAADAAFDLAVQRYQAGLGNFLTVLTAQTNVLAQRRAGTELKARHLVAEVTLARALGGGYQADADALPAQTASVSTAAPIKTTN